MLREPAGGLNRQRTSFSSRGSSLYTSRQSSLRHNRRGSARSTARSSISSLGRSSSYTNTPSYSTPRSSWGHEGILYDFPETIVESTHIHKHWCTHGKHQNTYDTCDGWKRHMNEHETVYRCMPLGQIENLGGIFRCAFCGIQDPSSGHLREHSAFECSGPSNTPLTKSRRSNMVRHLAAHGITGQAAFELAERWRCTLRKKAFSCGFCISVFSTLTEQLNHIDNAHFAQGQKMHAWSQDNVIRGLLLQPHISDAWQAVLNLRSEVRHSELRWNPPDAEVLQFRLEMGEQSGHDVAFAALNASNHEAIIHCRKEKQEVPTAMENKTRVNPPSLHSLPTSTVLPTNPVASNWGQDPRISQYDAGAWFAESNSLAQSSVHPSRTDPNSHDQPQDLSTRLVSPNEPIGSNFIQHNTFPKVASSFDDVPKKIHTEPSLFDTFNVSMPSGQWVDLSSDQHMQHSSHVAGASPTDECPYQTYGQPTIYTGAKAKAKVFAFPLRADSLGNTLLSSPAVRQTSVMLWGHVDQTNTCQRKPLPPNPPQDVEFDQIPTMDFDFDYI